MHEIEKHLHLHQHMMVMAFDGALGVDIVVDKIIRTKSIHIKRDVFKLIVFRLAAYEQYKHV